jgi:3-hydroxybutyryl-CoA dehydrogenase
MKLIELVRPSSPTRSVVATARRFAEQIGKSPVVVGDRRGFIANQLLFPYLNQAVEMVEGGYATKEDIDAAMRFGAGLPMGPLAWSTSSVSTRTPSWRRSTRSSATPASRPARS